jgi:hypothetical protein
VAIRIINWLLVMGLVLNAQSTHHTACTIKQALKPVYANKAISLTQARNYATPALRARSITMQAKLVALTAFQTHREFVLLRQIVTHNHALTFARHLRDIKFQQV